MSSKIFTPDEANQTLPLVKRIVDDILNAGRAVRALSPQTVDTSEGQAELQRFMDQLDELFEEIETLGCAYKDWNFSVGLVDFLAVLDGKEVFLCWRSDEKEVEFYHEIEAGFAGRQPIPKRSIHV